ncbi:protein strawberry notch homolog 1-like isoform X1 [Pomacea canaliculata]|uniref:protein strawberry notch homolog 1-like isoform X1 n=1 Tax=Pomacea canaliculata TaxID=400727 RepID=UPI000D73CAC0|nr:protein strawberry notch homolog 1-like isoform X1 [Pomacea canaliculata]
METETSSVGDFSDLLSAALNESGITGNDFEDDFSFESSGIAYSSVSQQVPSGQVIPAIPASPASNLTSQVISVRPSGGQLGNIRLVTPPHAVPTRPQNLPTVKVVQGTNPQGSGTPVTKIIRLSTPNSLLQRTGSTVSGVQLSNGNPAVIRQVVGSALPGAAGGARQPQIFTITRVPQTSGSVSLGSKKVILTTQGSGNAVAGNGSGTTQKIVLAQNGHTLCPIRPSSNGQHQVIVANINGQQKILQTTAGGTRMLIGANGQQVVRVAPPTKPVATTTVIANGLASGESAAGPQQRSILQSGSVSSVKTTSLLSSNSPVHVVSKAGLTGGKMISAAFSSVHTLGLRNSSSSPSLDSHSLLPSGSPAFGGNIPTIVTQKTGVGSDNLGHSSLNNSYSVNVPTIVTQQFGSGSESFVSANGPNVKANVSGKELSRIWSTGHFRTVDTLKLQHLQASQFQDNEEEEVAEEVEELGHAETYAEYMPSKLKIGEKHPDPVVETSSLSSVEPPDVRYRLSVPESVIDSGVLSALQLESITYASQQHETILPSGERAGYLIGDGAGVGKGRTVAGIIYENYLLGRKRALWLSVSNDLRVDAERDLRDIGAGKIEVYPLNKFKYAKISSKENGSVKKGVIFATYSSLIGESQSGGKYRTRLKQLLKWCGKDFDGVIVFDECHKAKNLCPTGSSKPTKTGQTVLELQNRLPKARVIYASATGASEPKNMAYMTRLGLWGPGTPFKEFNDFIQAVERRGVGAMELVAMDMKLRGMYIARQLSFQGVTFRIEEIPLDSEFKKVYDDAAELWMEARAMFQKAADLIQAEHRMRKSMWGQFWSAHQRFFKYLCISAKVPHCVALVREAVKAGKCVVIGLQSTGEARTLEQVEEMGGELNDFVSTAKGVFQTLVEKHFPAPDRRKAFDMLGLSNYAQRDNAESLDGAGFKRKRESDTPATKRQKVQSSDSSDSSSSASEASDFDLSANSDSDSDDNHNPFGHGGSDSDDDPWLKKSKKKTKPPKKKKEKKKKVKKSSSDEEDNQLDKALAAAGLLKKSNSYAGFSEKLNGSSSNEPTNGMDVWEKAFSMKSELLNLIERLGERLPPNTLDQLIDELGGPDNVAEMTGRKGRVVQGDDGIQYESRSEADVPLEILNLTEKQRFMDGEKNIAIISEAASSGISLQADRRAVNQRRRVHVTLELPWSADRAIQQFGRTHRSNQVSAPEYVFLISELAGERRFAATVAKRLESLGALTHGDRRATESRDLSRFNIDNKYGRAALDSVMKSVLNLNVDQPLVAPPASYKGNFLQDVKQCLEGVGLISTDERTGITVLEKDYNNISKFLNRLLGLPTTVQNAMFDYFNTNLTAIILEAKRSGRWDMGILDLGSGQEQVKRMETRVFVGNTATNTAKTELAAVQVERGMSWTSAMELWQRCKTLEEGFYNSLQERNCKHTSILIVLQGKNKKKDKVYNVYRPNTGLQSRVETLEEIKKKYKRVVPDEARSSWEDQYFASAHVCIHAYWNGHCKKTSLGLNCEIGLRTRQYHVLSGSVLSVWSRVESVLTSLPGGTASKMQIIRLRTDDGQRIIGSLIPPNCVQPLSNVLSQDSARTYTEKHHQSLDAAVNGLRGLAPTAATHRSKIAAEAVKASAMTSMQSVTSSEVKEAKEAIESKTSPQEPVLSMPVFDFL